MKLSNLDRERMLQALALAESAIGVTEPNPRVGCVIGSEDGRIFGVGATHQAGGDHAEAAALKDAARAGQPTAGATAWVTLEPCAHHGRTPPCCDALVRAGIARVVAAIQDPFPQVAGAGFDRLRAAGVRVAIADDDLHDAAHELNVGFFSRVQRGRPWVRTKIAASLDGRTALPDGQSQWITGPEARADGHAWRHRASAVLTGIGTVRADDPRLDVRLVPAQHQPLRIVLDTRFRIEPSARILAPPGKALVCGCDEGPARSALERAGVEATLVQGGPGGVDLQALMRSLAHRGINELHVEAGAGLNGSLLAAGLIDEILVYVAPMLVGQGRGWFDAPPLERLSAATRLEWREVRHVGPDLRVRLLTPYSKVSTTLT